MNRGDEYSDQNWNSKTDYFVIDQIMEMVSTGLGISGKNTVGPTPSMTSLNAQVVGWWQHSSPPQSTDHHCVVSGSTVLIQVLSQMSLKAAFTEFW